MNRNSDKLLELNNLYSSIKSRIENRLMDFKKLWDNSNDIEIFYELAFCLFTPQSKAHYCWEAVKTLINKDLIFSDDWEAISYEINYVRFRNNKARYLIEAKNKFLENGTIKIKEHIKSFKNNFEARTWFLKNIKGIGLKESSHFLRNIGFGENQAILDRHILRNLVNFNVIDEIPKTINEKKYYEIEKKMSDFAKDININICHLDFVLWYKEANDIFK